MAPPDVITRLVQFKQCADLHTSTFAQMVTYEVAKDGFIDEHVKTIRKCYRERRDAMLAALNDFFPPEVKWTHPQGGLFLWVTLPTGVDCMRMFDEAITHNVAFVPGQPFFAEGDAGSHMRLNFSNADAGDDSRGHSPVVDCGGARSGTRERQVVTAVSVTALGIACRCSVDLCKRAPDTTGAIDLPIALR